MKSLFRRALCAFTGVCLFLCLFPGAAASGTGTGFFRVEGDKILDPDGKQVVLKGISMGNVNYGNPSDISMGAVNSQDEGSYAELAAMGIDHVRFELNYGLFEDDDNPYVYKEAGFAWLDQNIAWAKKHGINLIIQMKHAQGGYQESTDRMVSTEYLGDGGKLLWMDINQESGYPIYGGTDYLENQNRLVALWTAIAQRYAGEKAIIGYGLLNEPVVPQKSTAEQTLAQWKDLAQRIADAIRTVDGNHILFVEQLLTFFKPNDYNGTDWNQISLENKQFLIQDDNTVYEFHFYEPFEFTSQGATGLDQYDGTANVYPSSKVISGNVDWNGSTINIDKGTLMETAGEWNRYEATFTTGAGQYVYANPQVFVPQLGSNVIYADDMTVTKTTAGTTETLYRYTFEDDDTAWWGYWDVSSPTVTRDQATSHGGNTSLRITGTVSPWANARSGDWFYMEPDSTYTVSVWLKNVDSNSSCTPRFELRSVSNVMALNKDYVSHMLDRYLSFGKTNNVPMFVGEWGVHNNCMDLGSDAYIKDLTDLFEEYGVSSNYHGYHDPDFGLYCEQEYLPRGERNETLYKSLVTHYGAQSPQIESQLFNIRLVNNDSTLAVSLSCGQESGKLLIAGYDSSGRFAGVRFFDVEKYDAYVEVPAGIERADRYRAFLLSSDGRLPLSPCIGTQ